MGSNAERYRRIGAAIARCREEEGVSQAMLTRMLGFTSHSYLSRIEKGTQEPSLELIFDVADALDVDVKYFFTDL